MNIVCLIFKHKPTLSGSDDWDEVKWVRIKATWTIEYCKRCLKVLRTVSLEFNHV